MRAPHSALLWLLPSLCLAADPPKLRDDGQYLLLSLPPNAQVRLYDNANGDGAAVKTLTPEAFTDADGHERCPSEKLKLDTPIADDRCLVKPFVGLYPGDGRPGSGKLVLEVAKRGPKALELVVDEGELPLFVPLRELPKARWSVVPGQKLLLNPPAPPFKSWPAFLSALDRCLANDDVQQCIDWFGEGGVDRGAVTDDELLHSALQACAKSLRQGKPTPKKLYPATADFNCQIEEGPGGWYLTGIFRAQD